MENFIDLIKSGAIDGWREYNIRPSITIAQGILESGWGDSGLAQQANNLFGIKWFPGCGHDVGYFDTQEFIQGQYVTMKEPFRVYASFNDSVRDHSELLSIPLYTPVRTAKSYQEAAWALYNCGYATAPNYADALINIVETYGLNYYDGEMFKMYKDADKISSYALNDVVMLNELKIMVGDDEGNFNPKAPITREQAASLIARTIRELRK